MALIDNIRNALGSAWHVAAESFYSNLLPATDGVAEASKPVTLDANKKVDVLDITTLKVNGTDKTTALGASVSAPIAGIAAGYKIARGQATTASASDTVVTGLATVVAVIASLDDAPTTDPEVATASIGDQAGAPAAGSILIKTWKTFGGTPAAATTFSKKVNWVAIGT